LRRGGSGGGETSSGGQSAEEEAQWRRWVDERFVRLLTANIYRSWE
jgi:microsomal prostaglandin-E synthase 2